MMVYDVVHNTCLQKQLVEQLFQVCERGFGVQVSHIHGEPPHDASLAATAV